MDQVDSDFDVSQSREFSSDFIDQYKRLRAVQIRLNNELVRTLTGDELNEGAKKLGFLRGDTFVFENEDQASVLMDYCIYNVIRDGRNAVERYCQTRRLDPESDEMTCLRAMLSAQYALVAVKRVEPGIGCWIENILSEQQQFLVDIGFSKSARPGIVIATRLINYGNYIATGGASLPLGVLINDRLSELRQRVRQVATDNNGDPAPLIRACLERGASSHVRYGEVGSQRRSDQGELTTPTASISGPDRKKSIGLTNTHFINRRCKCGSGKMYKNCCGKKTANHNT